MGKTGQNWIKFAVDIQAWSKKKQFFFKREKKLQQSELESTFFRAFLQIILVVASSYMNALNAITNKPNFFLQAHKSKLHWGSLEYEHL